MRRIWVLAGARQAVRRQAHDFVRARLSAHSGLAARTLWLGAAPTVSMDEPADAADDFLDKSADGGPKASVKILEDGLVAGPAGTARQWLGRELDLLVFDAWSGLDVDALGAASGTLRGGGLLLLLCPPLSAWAQFADPEHARIAVHPYTAAQVSGRFLQRLVRLIGAFRLPVYAAGDPLPGWQPPAGPPGNSRLQPTVGQRQVIEAVRVLPQSAGTAAVVVTADRGRGKSAALGMAAADLVAAGYRLILTAPRRAAVDAVLARLPTMPEEAAAGSAGGLCYMAPDALLQQRPPADVLLVDEAAAIPAALLQEMLALWPRCVFATTVHGYEGNGRGFAVRFLPLLRARVATLHCFHLPQPVRWAAEDRLEAFIFRALLLDARPGTPVPADERLASHAGMKEGIERIARDRLLQDESLLEQVFGLLVLAHYRTSPLDLRHLLDGPNVTVWALHERGAVVATALTVREGGFDRALAEEIYRGRRRPRGHLIPQSLALHGGFAAAARLAGERIMRIAVHPEARRRGLGTMLVQAIAARAREDGLDFVAVSFAADADGLAFWRAQAFVPLRLGLRREPSSGRRALQAMHALSADAGALQQAIHQRFLRHLPLQTTDDRRSEYIQHGGEQSSRQCKSSLQPAGASLHHSAMPDDVRLHAELLSDGLQRSPGLVEPIAPDEQDRLDVESFINGWRGYELCHVAIHKLVAGQIARAELSPASRRLLELKVLQQADWKEVANRLGYPGRAAAETALRDAVAACRRQNSIW